jgi:Fusaric acid resistance protein-like
MGWRRDRLDQFGRLSPLAAIAAVVCLGLTRGQRLRRPVEWTLGVGLGVGVGDLLISAIGAAPRRIALVVALAMSVAVLPDGRAVIAIQAAIWAVLKVTPYLPGLASGDRGCDRAPARRRVPTELSTPAVIVTGTRGALSQWR